MRRNEARTQATTRINLKMARWAEAAWHKRPQAVGLHSYGMSRGGKIQRDGKQTSSCQGLGVSEEMG